MEKQQVTKFLECAFTIGRFMKGEMGFEKGKQRLTLLQLQILLLLMENRGMMMQEIAQYFNVTKPTATSFLKNLVKLGLVKRTESKKDRRVVKVTVTKKGMAIVKRARKYREERVQRLLSFLDETDQQNLSRILANIAGKLRGTKQ